MRLARLSGLAWLRLSWLTRLWLTGLSRFTRLSGLRLTGFTGLTFGRCFSWLSCLSRLGRLPFSWLALGRVARWLTRLTFRGLSRFGRSSQWRVPFRRLTRWRFFLIQ